MTNFEDRLKKGVVFNIQKYSVHDGPGIRTIVFLKGCPLSCRWCSNPESQRGEPELAFNPNRCLTISKCTRCFQVCERRAITCEEDNRLKIERFLCDGCKMHCSLVCPAKALIVYGELRTVDEVLDIVEQDAAFYARSKGGMTISGGEPFIQFDFTMALLKEACRRRINTAVETCGMVQWKILETASEYLDFVLFDIKHIDSAIHEEHTGASNKLILDNFCRLTELDPQRPIRARTPIIPGFNDSEEVIASIAEFIRPYQNVTYEILPYHRMGMQKYLFLDRTSPMGDVVSDKEKMIKLNKTVAQILGNRVYISK
jgi:pyruvate formate lyase activating enzyme